MVGSCGRKRSRKKERRTLRRCNKIVLISRGKRDSGFVQILGQMNKKRQKTKKKEEEEERKTKKKKKKKGQVK